MGVKRGMVSYEIDYISYYFTRSKVIFGQGEASKQNIFTEKQQARPAIHDFSAMNQVPSKYP